MPEGYWSSHKYKRHSVAEIEEFCGWGALEKISKAGSSERDKALPVFIFETGCRISEVLQLRACHFELSDPEFVKCVNIPIVKQKKIGVKTRTFSFPKSEPLYQCFEDYLRFISRLGSRTKDPLLFPISRVHAWRVITEQGKRAGFTIWDHWFRSQRASQLGAEYEFTENELMEWFKVIDRTWARRYCKKGDFGLRKVMQARAPSEYRK